jgi:hypothetical protein
MRSLQWGLLACGMDCTMHVNHLDAQRTNIVFGWIIGAQLGALNGAPDDTILYNFEQFSQRPLAGTGLGALAQRFQIWDYSAANLPRWLECQPRRAPVHAPVSFAPNLVSMAADAPTDIDLLFVGSSGGGRAAKLAEIATAPNRPSVLTLQNVWGAERDAFIARSRILLNLSNDDPALRIFEEVRVAHYLANRKCVVCEDVPGQHVEPDMRAALTFAKRADLPATCERLLADHAERARLAAQGFDAFRQRDVRDLVRRHLA